MRQRLPTLGNKEFLLDLEWKIEIIGKILSRRQFRVLIPVLSIGGAGGFGGLLAALLTRATGVGMFALWPALQDVATEMVFGVAAAILGVYLLSTLLSTTNPTPNPRTLAFALACGLAWQPMVTGATSYVKQYANNSKTTSKATNAVSSLGNGSPSSGEIQASATATTDAMGKLSEITNSADRADIINASKTVLKKVAASDAAPASVKIDAYRSIGLASLTADSQSVSLEAIQPLKELAASKDEATQVQAKSALQDLANEARAKDLSRVSAAAVY